MNNNQIDTKKVIDAIKLVGITIWTAGFLFSLGVIGINPNFTTYSFGEQILYWVSSYVLWPLLLGLRYSE